MKRPANVNTRVCLGEKTEHASKGVFAIITYFFKHSLKLSEPQMYHQETAEGAVEVSDWRYSGVLKVKKFLNLLKEYHPNFDILLNRSLKDIEPNEKEKEYVCLLNGLKFYQALLLNQAIKNLLEYSPSLTVIPSEEERLKDKERINSIYYTINVAAQLFTMDLLYLIDGNLCYLSIIDGEEEQTLISEIQQVFLYYHCKFEYYLSKEELVVNPYYMLGMLDISLWIRVQIYDLDDHFARRYLSIEYVLSSGKKNFETLNNQGFKIEIVLILPTMSVEYSPKDPIYDYANYSNYSENSINLVNCQTLISYYFQKECPRPNVNLKKLSTDGLQISFIKNKDFLEHLIFFFDNYFITSFNSGYYKFLVFLLKEGFFDKNFVLSSKKCKEYQEKSTNDFLISVDNLERINYFEFLEDEKNDSR